MRLRGWQLISMLAAAAFGIAFIAGIGGITGEMILASWGQGQLPMQPVMALLLMVKIGRAHV